MPASRRSRAGFTAFDLKRVAKPEAADLAIDEVEATYAAKYPKAVDKVLKDRGVLLAHFDLPAEHWVHLRTTDEIVKSAVGARAQGLPTKTLFFLP